MRWQHPTRGLLYPDAFLPLVEQSGLMQDLTGTVLEQAIEQPPAGARTACDITVAVNLSASDLLDEQLAERIVEPARRHDVPDRARSSSRSPRTCS